MVVLQHAKEPPRLLVQKLVLDISVSESRKPNNSHMTH
jgi:hypothetical protein